MRVRDPARLRELLQRPDAAQLSDELVRLFVETGALLEGHFRLQSGLHSPYFVRVGQLVYRPEDTRVAVDAMLERSPSKPKTIDVVISAENASQYLGRGLAERLGARFIAVPIDEQRKPRADAALPELSKRGARALVVSDVVTTGSSIETLVERARAHGALVREVLCLGTLDSRGFQRTCTRLRVPGGAAIESSWTPVGMSGCTLSPAEIIPAYELS